jgi:hypothetical protein
VLWIGYQKNDQRAVPNVFEKAFTLAITFVLAVHVYWCATAVYNDYFNNYSASRDVADQIKRTGLTEKRIFASGWKNTAIQPYFDSNIFYNFNEGSEQRFWIWSTSNNTPFGLGPEVLARIQAGRPDIVILASDHLDANNVTPPPGYVLDGLFPGYQYWKTGIHELNAYWIFRRIDGANAESNSETR